MLLAAQRLRVVADVDRAFTHELPSLLCGWYRGAAMLDDYEVTASMEDDEYQRLYEWMQRFQNSLPHQDRPLYRCINVPPDIAGCTDGQVPGVVHMTPGKNALCSWTDSQKSAEDFFKLLQEKDRVEPDSVAFIVRHDMPGDAQCLNHKQAIRLHDYAMKNAPSEVWGRLGKVLEHPAIKSQREYVCNVPQMMNMEVVSVLKNGVHQ